MCPIEGHFGLHAYSCAYFCAQFFGDRPLARPSAAAVQLQASDMLGHRHQAQLR